MLVLEFHYLDQHVGQEKKHRNHTDKITKNRFVVAHGKECGNTEWEHDDELRGGVGGQVCTVTTPLTRTVSLCL